MSNLTVAMLYEEFIDLVIRRELDKDARRAFDEKIRRRFAGKLAFWLWQDDQKSEVDGCKIPDSFFKEFSKSKDDDLSVIRRDLLSGCFLERKNPNLFYFPHRSFQEYLVADRLSTLAVNNSEEINECPYLTNEILSFFVELIGRRGVVNWRKMVMKHNLKLDKEAKRLLTTSCAYYRLSSPFAEGQEKGPDSKVVLEAERDRLISRLLVGEIVSDRENKKERIIKTKKRTKIPHKMQGVTRKKAY